MSRLSLLVDLAALLTREVDLDALLSAACERVAEALGADRASIWLVDAERGDLVTRVALLPEVPQLRQALGKGLAGYVAETGEVVRVDDAPNDPRFDPSADRETGYSTRNMLVVPIRRAPELPVRGVVQLLNKANGRFDAEDERYLHALATQLGRALELTTLRPEKRSDPGLTLRGPFNHIVGLSEPMKRVYERIGRAAGTDASVIFRGATGTGKTLLARAVHVNSARQTGPFVVVDCTTLPSQLVESELFGHERGAFTGADRRVPGKVELARGGSLLLDEVGDLPLESQGKLLRLLQDRCYERVGGRETLQADVRVLAATHRDLEHMLAKGQFREDLYYRLRVVEVQVPSLQERGASEIEILLRHFIERASERHGRPALRLDARTLATLVARPWPGNVRELEHWVESATVLSSEGLLHSDLLNDSTQASRRESTTSADAWLELPLDLQLNEASRRYAERVLALHGGNKTDTARALGISRNTLSRLLKP
ncbi:MAG: sigma-54-dependent Fis family transcriptional regulator [Myxococcales bacterium]|nr:sigma-54-dependent Fis family transcriptional regulator [Myxococcales bacterium]